MDALIGIGPGALSAGWVTNVVVFDDDGEGPRAPGLYAAGGFTYMGNVRAQGIARWDGRAWSRLGANPGSGLVAASGTYSMTVWGPPAGQEELYVIADVVGANFLGIARWNGTQWRQAATNSLHYYFLGYQRGFPSSVWSVDPDGSGPLPRTLYAAQTEIAAFQTHGGTWGSVWTLTGPGGTWQREPYSPEGQPAGRVDAMVVFDGDGAGPGRPGLYLTRYADQYANEPIPPFPPLSFSSEAHISKVEGGALVDVVSTDGGAFTSLAVFDADGPGPGAAQLYVAGAFTVGMQEGVHLARLDGTTLTPLGNDDGTVEPALEVIDEDGDGPQLARLWVRGNFTQIGGIAANGVAKFDGVTWTAAGPGIPAQAVSTPPVKALCAFDDDGAGPKPPMVYAGGGFTRAGYADARGIARWNGNSWMPPGPLLNNAVRTLLAADVGQGQSLYLGGAFTAADGWLAVGVARWDGESLSRLGAGMNNRVEAMAVYGGALIAAGKFTWAGGSTANHVARWNGAQWSAMGAGVDGDVNAVAVNGGDLIVAGTFLNAGGAPAERVARWNGVQWSAMGAGLNGEVTALVMHDGSLFAGGLFGGSGATGAAGVARWNGTAWVSTGWTEPYAVTHLVSYKGKLYAAARGPIGLLYEWSGGSGGSWTSVVGFALPTGVGSLTALGVADEDGAGPGEPFLYASGEFATAGSVGADRLARWDGTTWTAGSAGSAGLSAPGRAFAVFGDPPVLFVGGDFKGVGSGGGLPSWFLAGYDDCPLPCYANCDGSTIAPVLNINDFVCFQQRFSAGYPDANCDGSTMIPLLNVNDFICFLGRFAAGCP
jgi:hypothetical protein